MSFVVGVIYFFPWSHGCSRLIHNSENFVINSIYIFFNLLYSDLYLSMFFSLSLSPFFLFLTNLFWFLTAQFILTSLPFNLRSKSWPYYCLVIQSGWGLGFNFY